MQKRIVFGAAAALLIGVSASAYAQTTPENCQAMFQKADVNKDGSLQQQEAQVFIGAMNKAEVKPKDAATVTQDEFMTACKKDAFASIDPATIGTQQATTEQPASDQAASGTATTDQSATGTATTTATDQTATTTTTPDQTASTTTTTDTAAPAAPATEQALAVPDALMASNLIGANIYSNNNENIAKIKDVVISPEGQATHVIVDAGDNDVAVDLKELQIAATEDGLKVLINGSQTDLAKFPVVNKQ